MSTYRCARATTSHAAEVFGWRRRGFPPSGVPRGAPWELDARSPPGSQKTGLDARRGPASWERPVDGGNASLRHACAHRAPGGSRHAPHDGLDALAAESEISLISAHFYGGGARGDASVMALWEPSRPRVSRVFKRPKNGYSQNAAQRRRLFGRIRPNNRRLDVSANKCAR